jgi:hypothetical protein
VTGLELVVKVAPIRQPDFGLEILKGFVAEVSARLHRLAFGCWLYLMKF